MEQNKQQEAANRVGYAASLVEPSMNIHFMDPNQIQHATANLAMGNISAMSSTAAMGYKKGSKFKNITMDGTQQLTEVSS